MLTEFTPAVDHRCKLTGNPRYNYRGQINTSGLDRRIADAKRMLRKQNLQLDRLTLQVASRAIRQKRFNRLAAPIETAIEHLEEEVELLVRQKREIEKWEGVEERVRVALARYADSLNQPDQEGL